MITMLWVTHKLLNNFFLLFILIFSWHLPLWGQVLEKLQEEKELEVVEFKKIQEVLKKDDLEKALLEKKKSVKTLKKTQKKVLKENYFYPKENDFWGFISEYWLVKNASLLSWDFEKPDYGLDVTFAQVLRTHGFYRKKFKILFSNSPVISHAALPSYQNEIIFVVSIPFVRAMDLSRLEISLLMLEDYLRLQEGYLKKNVLTDSVKAKLGTSFLGVQPALDDFKATTDKISEKLLKTGFSFQEQFDVTKKMDQLLKAKLEHWGVYFKLISKIDNLVKMNNLFKDYSKIYPSPEMQLKWLSPKKKVL